jgi:hypothetical protein
MMPIDTRNPTHSEPVCFGREHERNRGVVYCGLEIFWKLTQSLTQRGGAATKGCVAASFQRSAISTFAF